MKYRLLLMDMDSTLINEEGIDLLARLAGVEDQVAALTTSAMQGKSDFSASLRTRVDLLAGVSINLLKEVSQSLTFTTGAIETINSLKSIGWRIGVVSGGFHDIIDQPLRSLELDFVRANRFRVRNEVVTGVLDPIVGPVEKESALREFAESFNIPLSQTVAVGDGANDIQMIRSAGLGVAFCAKPALKEVADLSIEERDFRLLLGHL